MPSSPLPVCSGNLNIDTFATHIIDTKKLSNYLTSTGTCYFPNSEKATFGVLKRRKPNAHFAAVPACKRGRVQFQNKQNFLSPGR